MLFATRYSTERQNDTNQIAETRVIELSSTNRRPVCNDVLFAVVSAPRCIILANIVFLLRYEFCAEIDYMRRKAKAYSTGVSSLLSFFTLAIARCF